MSSESLVQQIEHALSTRPPGEAVGAALETLVRHYAAHMGTVHRLDAADRHLYLVASSGPIPEPVLAVTRRIPLGKGIAGEAAATGKAVSICNLQSPTAGVPAGARAAGASGALCVPILQGESIVGTLGIGCAGERTFTDTETADLLAAGRVLADAVVRSVS